MQKQQTIFSCIPDLSTLEKDLCLRIINLYQSITCQVANGSNTINLMTLSEQFSEIGRVAKKNRRSSQVLVFSLDLQLLGSLNSLKLES